MRVLEVAPGLWRWTARHPEWTHTADWPEEVASVYWEGGDTVCLVDPLVPADEEERFFRHLDADLERAGGPPAIVLTTADHERSAAVLAARYGASVWACHAGHERLAVSVDSVFEAGDALPGGFVPLDSGRHEALLWLPAARSLLVADVLVGDPLRVSPWAEGEEEQRRTLQALEHAVALPVETVLVAHGPPVLRRGADALARAVEAATIAA